MVKITKIQFWDFEHKNKYNEFMRLLGNETLRMSRDNTGTYYRTWDTNKLVAKAIKDGYFVDEKIYPLLKVIK